MYLTIKSPLGPGESDPNRKATLLEGLISYNYGNNLKLPRVSLTDQIIEFFE